MPAAADAAAAEAVDELARSAFRKPAPVAPAPPLAPAPLAPAPAPTPTQVKYAVTGPSAVADEAAEFALQVWAVVVAQLQLFKEELEQLKMRDGCSWGAPVW